MYTFKKAKMTMSKVRFDYYFIILFVLALSEYSGKQSLQAPPERSRLNVHTFNYETNHKI